MTRRRLQILFLTDNFPPEVNAPASRTFEHCREWVKAGHEVTVVTGVPNFPKGRVFGGYTNYPWQREEIEGIRVIRVITYITANEGFGRRTIDYISFMVTSCLAGLFSKRPDVLIGTSPQFFTVCSTWMVSTLRRIPFIFEVRDLWPDSIQAVNAMRSPFWLGQLKRLEYFLYRKAALIVTLTDSFNNIITKGGVERAKIKTVLNGVDLKRFRREPKSKELMKRYGLEGKFVVGYVGTHGLAHSLETILDAACLLQNQVSNGDIVFLFMGDGARKQALVDETKQRSLKNVVFIGTVMKDEIVRYWSLLDVSVIHLKNDPLFESVIPSKLFESMAMGVPVLHGVKGESAGIVDREHVGLVFEPDNAEALRSAVERLKNDRARYETLRGNCLKTARHYDRRRQARKMLEYLDDVVVSEK